ncbi:pro-resilin-like [Macrobrachium rosenbergii]|uniref:pro-resilin-like n=1 Tax=Macrobrachium rosenbergii TaxID=79674 RepID=UPI0034D71368
MYAKVALLCLVAAVAVARPDKRPPPPPVGYEYAAPDSSASGETHEGMPFDFGYVVKDDDSDLDFGHSSNSDGRLTTGEYRVALPDSRTLIVRYTVDRLGGYQPTVEYEGEAQYPEPQSSNRRASSSAAPAQSYSAPSPAVQRPSSLYGAPN